MLRCPISVISIRSYVLGHENLEAHWNLYCMLSWKGRDDSLNLLMAAS